MPVEGLATHVRERKMVLLALFPLLMIGTVLVVALSVGDDSYAWDGTATLSQKPATPVLENSEAQLQLAA
ncbi:MAG: hypothetical protein RL414_723 [Actinomycetota bacterium]|jgi:hypothetical protein